MAGTGSAKDGLTFTASGVDLLWILSGRKGTLLLHSGPVFQRQGSQKKQVGSVTCGPQKSHNIKSAEVTHKPVQVPTHATHQGEECYGHTDGANTEWEILF